MIKFVATFLILSSSLLQAGPFSPAANQPGTDAISKDYPRITRWANQVVEYTAGEDVDTQWQDSTQALGEVSGMAFDVVSLGRGGTITLGFSEPIRDISGPDFLVFENSFSHRFLELAFVEVSSDGINFARFPSRSLTAVSVGSFGETDPTNIDGLAGKFIGGFGTPFDLNVLRGHANLDVDSITQIRLIDIAGDGRSQDSHGDPIYDPFPTFGSAGFDLDGIAVIDAPPLSVVHLKESSENFEITWALDPNSSHRLYFNPNLTGEWTPLEEIPKGSVYLTRRFRTSGRRGFWRIEQLLPASE